MRFAILAVLAVSLGVAAPGSSGAQEWVECGTEGERCDFAGIKLVRFGASDRFRFGTFTDGVECSNARFDDPVAGRRKTCWIYRTASEAAEEQERARLTSRLREREELVTRLEDEVEARDEHIRRLESRLRRLEERRPRGFGPPGRFQRR
jgi:hypothetical protein